MTLTAADSPEVILLDTYRGEDTRFYEHAKLPPGRYSLQFDEEMFDDSHEYFSQAYNEARGGQKEVAKFIREERRNGGARKLEHLVLLWQGYAGPADNPAGLEPALEAALADSKSLKVLEIHGWRVAGWLEKVLRRSKSIETLVLSQLDDRFTAEYEGAAKAIAQNKTPVKTVILKGEWKRGEWMENSKLFARKVMDHLRNARTGLKVGVANGDHCDSVRRVMPKIVAEYDLAKGKKGTTPPLVNVGGNDFVDEQTGKPREAEADPQGDAATGFQVTSMKKMAMKKKAAQAPMKALSRKAAQAKKTQKAVKKPTKKAAKKPTKEKKRVNK